MTGPVFRGEILGLSFEEAEIAPVATVLLSGAPEEAGSARVSGTTRQPLALAFRSYTADKRADVVEGRIDIARSGPPSYVIAHEADAGISLLAIELASGET